MKLLTTLLIALTAAGGAAAVDQETYLRQGSENMQLLNDKLTAENKMLKEQIANMIASSKTTDKNMPGSWSMDFVEEDPVAWAACTAAAKAARAGWPAWRKAATDAKAAWDAARVAFDKKTAAAAAAKAADEKEEAFCKGKPPHWRMAPPPTHLFDSRHPSD